MRFILLIGLVSLLFGNDYLSDNYNEKIFLKEKKNTQSSKKLQNDWVNPIIYSYNYSDDEKLGVSKTSIIAIDQPIFRSGGIYNAIIYANNIKALNKTAITLERNNLIKTVINLSYNIKKLDLQIIKQKRLLQNAQIDLKTKKENVFKGLLDISFLNDAIIKANNIKLALLDIEQNRFELVNKLKNISKLPYEKIATSLPQFKLFNLDKFLKQDLDIEQKKYEIDTKRSLKFLTYAKYLPSINLTYQHIKDHKKDITKDIAGFKIVIPLDIKAFYEPKSAKLDELIAKKELEIAKKDEISLFENIEYNVKILDKKIKLTKKNILAYKDIADDTKQMVKAGLKTDNDLKILLNSLLNEKTNLQIYNIDKQLQLLELYSKIGKFH